MPITTLKTGLTVVTAGRLARSGRLGTQAG
jgi:hypothetical protein